MPLAEVTGNIENVAFYAACAVIFVAGLAFPNWRIASIARSRAREKEAEARIAEVKIKEAQNVRQPAARPQEGVHF